MEDNVKDHLVVAVDGPSGSGKSSTARGVALALALDYLDTGAMYRALTWALLQGGVDVNNPSAVAGAAETVTLTVATDPAGPRIDANGEDVSVRIRGREVTAAVSAVSAVPQVRAKLVGQQRSIIAGAGGIVVEGRDIGVTVAPGAALKVFLVADVSARAARRSAELGQSGADVTSTRVDLERRDHTDSSRVSSPLAQADDAVLIDSTDKSLDEVIDEVVALAGALS